MDEDIRKRISSFKKDLRNPSVSLDRIIDRYIVFGTPYIFRNNEDDYYSIKEEVAKSYKIRTSCIFMVGSSKLGFSIKPGQLFREIQPDSDIDLTIIDSRIFDECWIKLLDFFYFEKLGVFSAEEVAKIQRFKEYFFKGWIRLDLLIPGMPLYKENAEIRKQLFNKYDNRTASIGIFRDESFFQKYHELNINKLRNK